MTGHVTLNVAQYVYYSRAVRPSKPRSLLARTATLPPKPLQRGALRIGMIPVINQMSAAGVIRCRE